jgi:ABC-type Fe3+-hydroxamate transport system substrate-binding protein
MFYTPLKKERRSFKCVIFPLLPFVFFIIDSFEEIGKLFKKAQESEAVIQFWRFRNSLNSIEGGAPVDVFASQRQNKRMPWKRKD